MDFNYGSSFGERSPSAYETLLLDAIMGDATLYTRQDMVEASWSVGAADTRLLEHAEVRLPELRGRNMGTSSRRRNACALRSSLGGALMSRRHLSPTGY